jgi:hypothetical protein
MITTGQADNIFRSYSGTELLGLKFNKRPWLVDRVMRERDSVLFVGNEKVGKSLFIQQMMFNMTSGTPFLDQFDVARECRVSYLQLEGELEDTQDRAERMIRSNVQFKPENFQILFYPTVDMQDLNVTQELFKAIMQFHQPDLVVVDCVYAAMRGSLSDDEAVRAFLSNVRWLKNALHCAVLMIHHRRKSRFDNHGKVVEEDDDSTFGSKFLKAFPDSIFMFSLNQKTMQRTLTCATQRSGDIVRDTEIVLNEPDPLYFTVGGLERGRAVELYQYLQQCGDEGASVVDIMDRFAMSRPTVFRTLRDLGATVTHRKNGKQTTYVVTSGQQKEEQ